jgi:hypothetical protein
MLGFAPLSQLPLSTLPAAAGGAFSIAANAGSYVITGTAATLKATRVILGASSTYVITGQPAALKVGRRVAAVAGSYTVNGQAATLTYTPLAGAFTIVAAAGAYVITGTAATLKAARKVAANAGTYTISGQVATLKAGRRVVALAGSYTITGTAANLVKTPIFATVPAGGGGATPDDLWWRTPRTLKGRLAKQRKLEQAVERQEQQDSASPETPLALGEYHDAAHRIMENALFVARADVLAEAMNNLESDLSARIAYREFIERDDEDILALLI